MYIYVCMYAALCGRTRSDSRIGGCCGAVYAARGDYKYMSKYINICLYICISIPVYVYIYVRVNQTYTYIYMGVYTYIVVTAEPSLRGEG